MLKIDMGGDIIREISCNGDILTIIAELSLAIGQIYNDLSAINPKAGEIFRNLAICSWNDASNPMWTAVLKNQSERRCHSIRIDEDLIRRARGGNENA